MSSPERKKQREIEFEKEQQERAKEERRKAELSMYMKIEEAAIDEDLKCILHKIAKRLGMED